MRLVRPLARLAVFKAGAHNATYFIAFEPATMRALSWVCCHLLASHDHDVRCEPGRIFLACRRCGARSRGLVFDEVPGGSRPRTAPAVADEPTVDRGAWVPGAPAPVGVRAPRDTPTGWRR